jgi:hypothetical protein
LRAQQSSPGAGGGLSECDSDGSGDSDVLLSG